MLSNDVLLGLVRTAESQYLERKASCPGTAELEKTLCAFANSTPEGQISVLLIGVRDDGTVVGISDNLDSIQKTVVAVGRNQCYPPIPVFPQVFEVEGKPLLAVVVEHSKTKPHFTGHAYKRRGCESEKASDTEYTEFVLQRSDKTRRILKERGQTVSVNWAPGTSTGRVPADERDYLLEGCDGFVVHLIDGTRPIAVPMEQVMISHDAVKQRMKLLVSAPFPDAPPSFSAVLI